MAFVNVCYHRVKFFYGCSTRLNSNPIKDLLHMWPRLMNVRSQSAGPLRVCSSSHRCWSTPHLGDLWDLVWVDGPAVLRRRHRVPGIVSLCSLLSGLYSVNEIRNLLSVLHFSGSLGLWAHWRTSCLWVNSISAGRTEAPKEDLNLRTDLAVSCCPWRAAAGGPFSAPPAPQS